MTEKTLFERLKVFRKEIGKNQREMSEILKVKPSYYSDVETGKRPITGKLVEKLMASFNISSDWLYTGEGSMHGKIKESMDAKARLIKEYRDKTAPHYFNFINDLKNENPELYSFFNNLLKVQVCRESEDEIYKHYLQQIADDLTDLEVEKYSEYKKTAIDHLMRNLKYKAFCESVLESAEKIKRDFLPLDEDKILSSAQD